jgi:hypothetical protein
MATVLKSRIATLGMRPPDMSVIAKNYGSVHEIPLIRIQVHPGGAQVSDMQPLITADGAPVAATMPCTWGQLYAAGRMA